MRTFKECVVKHKVEFLGLCHLHSIKYSIRPGDPFCFGPWKMDAPCLKEWHDVVRICFLSFCNEAKDWSIAFGREVQLTALANIIEMRVPRLEDWKECIECIAISNNAEHSVCGFRITIRHVSVNCKCAPVLHEARQQLVVDDQIWDWLTCIQETQFYTCQTCLKVGILGSHRCRT